MMLFYLKMAPLSEKWDGVIEILRSVIDLIRGKPGCIDCVYFEAHDPHRSLLYLEQWESPEDLHRHIQSKLFTRIISAVELARETPKICFYEVSKTMGIELIETVRAVGENKADVTTA